MKNWVLFLRVHLFKILIFLFSNFRAKQEEKRKKEEEKRLKEEEKQKEEEEKVNFLKKSEQKKVHVDTGGYKQSNSIL